MEARKPSGITLGVRFTAAGDQLYGQSRAGERDPLAGIRSMLDPAIVKAMVEAEPTLMEWLRASRENVVQFTMDPMAALKKALPDFDPGLLARIAELRVHAQRAKVDLPGVKVDRFSVDVAPAAKAK